MAKGVTIDLIVDPSGATKGMQDAGDGAGKFTSILGDLGQVGAAAVAAVATAAVAAGAALVAATVSAGQYADEILTAATNTNLSTEELQAYKYAAELMDVSFETFIKSQGKFTKSMQDAVDSGTSPAAEGFAALGLSVTDADGNLVDSTKLYWQAVDALAGVDNETQRTALAQQIFGKSGAEMNSIIAQGSEGFAKLTEEARKNGAIMSGEQLEKLGAFDDKMQSLTSTVDAAKNALGLTLLPVLDDLAGSGTNALGQFTTALLEADGDLSKAGPAFETLGTNVAAALTTAIPKILQVGTSLISGLIQGIVSQAPALIKTAVPLLVSFVTTILGMLPAILNAGIKVLVALIQGISAALPTLIPAAVKAILGLVSALVDNLPLLIDAGIQLLIGVGLGLIQAIPQIVEKLPEIITSLVTGLVGAIPQLVLAGVQLFLAIIQNLPAIIKGIISAVPAIINALVMTLGDPKFWAALGDAGFQLVKGLWEGIKGAGDWLWRQLTGFWGGVIDNIKKLFGIHSPSTVFAGFGKNMILGLELGLTGPNHIGPILSRLSNQVVSGFDATFGESAARIAVASTGGGYAPTPEPKVVYPAQLVIVDADRQLIGRMQVEADGRIRRYDKAAVQEQTAGWRPD